ncbi:MAG TPA: glycosyltransferase family 4 protein [Gaiellaceae bacterium]|jgi:glycosyltransferase involved in cell wall biosynthesis
MLVNKTLATDARVRRSARELAAAGLDVTVLGTARKGEPASRADLGFDLRLVPVRHASRVRVEAAAAGPDPLGLQVFDRTWWPAVKRLRPDVVHVHDSHGLAVALRAAREGARWIWDTHEDPVAHPLKRARRLGIDRAVLAETIRRELAGYVPSADAVITVSASIAAELVRLFDLPRPPAVVHNTPPLVVEKADPPGLRERAGVAPGLPLVVYAGDLSKRRNVSVVVEALEHLPGVHLVLVVTPTGKPVAKIFGLAERLRISDRVHVVPKVPPEQLVSLLGTADVGVDPRLRDPDYDVTLPNKIFEYLHAGLAQVVSDCAAMAEVVRRYGFGEVAPADDARAWAAALRRALETRPWRERTREWESLKEEWCWERQAEVLLDVYRDVLGVELPVGTPRAASHALRAAE